MSADDITQVADIERESFPSMWPQTAYRRELTNKIARYLVICEPHEEPPAAQPAGLWGTLRRIVGSDGAPRTGERLLGFIGLWLMVGEAHVVTVAVREDHRRMGIGERLLIAGIELAMEYDQEVVTLEVRASNESAQRLYEKYGFARVGLRRRYYTDNNEDAVLMTTPELTSPGYRALFEDLRAQHQERCPDLWT
jgi:ribosomal-protein-alanine N-acetyltransferase